MYTGQLLPQEVLYVVFSDTCFEILIEGLGNLVCCVEHSDSSLTINGSVKHGYLHMNKPVICECFVIS